MRSMASGGTQSCGGRAALACTAASGGQRRYSTWNAASRSAASRWACSQTIPHRVEFANCNCVLNFSSTHSIPPGHCSCTTVPSLQAKKQVFPYLAAHAAQVHVVISDDQQRPAAALLERRRPEARGSHVSRGRASGGAGRRCIIARLQGCGDLCQCRPAPCLR